MELSGKVLREVEFRDRLRGYDTDEVDDFLEQVAVAVDELLAEQEALRQRAERAERQLQEVPEVDDDGIRRTLVLAQRTADLAVREARAEADRLLADARAQADAVVGEAEDEAARMRDEMDAELRQRTSRLAEQHERLTREIRILEALVESERARITQSLGEALRYVSESLNVSDDVSAALAPIERQEDQQGEHREAGRALRPDQPEGIERAAEPAGSAGRTEGPPPPPARSRAGEGAHRQGESATGPQPAVPGSRGGSPLAPEGGAAAARPAPPVRSTPPPPPPPGGPQAASRPPAVTPLPGPAGAPPPGVVADGAEGRGRGTVAPASTASPGPAAVPSAAGPPEGEPARRRGGELAARTGRDIEAELLEDAGLAGGRRPPAPANGAARREAGSPGTPQGRLERLDGESPEDDALWNRWAASGGGGALDPLADPPPTQAYRLDPDGGWSA